MKTLDLCAIISNNWASDFLSFSNKTMKTMDLGGQIPPVDRVILGTKIDNENHRSGGPPRAKEYIVNPDLGDTARWRPGDVAASRSDPTFTRASPGLRQ